MDGKTDLFGNPVRDGFGQKGRPPYQPTDKERNKVKLLLALGWSNARIAKAIDVSLPTLREHFSSELKSRLDARDQLLARRIERTFELAEAGNVSAEKYLGDLIEENDRALADERVRRAQGKGLRKPAEAPARKLGKKEAAEAAAEGLGDGKSGWGDDILPGFEPKH